jgi:hypothetical protein
MVTPFATGREEKAGKRLARIAKGKSKQAMCHPLGPHGEIIKCKEAKKLGKTFR